MLKKLTRVGNSFGLIIDRPILDLLEIDEDTPLKLRTDGESLNIEPVRGETDDHEDRVAKSAERMMDIHEETLKKLAE